MISPPKLIPETKSSEVASKAKRHFLTVPQCLKPTRPAKSPIMPMHRCFLISEIFCLILEFIQQSDESRCAECGCMADKSLGKGTLVSLARTCRAFSAPALDLLWMRLNSLDPLIKVLPSRIWAKKRSRFVVRMLMNDKHWLTFHKYAVRVRLLRGPCRRIPSSVQYNVIDALIRSSGTSLPLLPNLTELVWDESDACSAVNPTVSLIKYFAGPRVTTISLFLAAWPIIHSGVSARDVLADLPNLYPNVTSFTAVTRATYNDHSRDIGDIVSKWSGLQVLHTCALSQTVMDELASKETLKTLNIELNGCVPEVYVERLPTTVRTFSLEGSNALHCIRYLQTLKGSPSSVHLHVGVDVTLLSDMETLFRMLPTHFDTTQLRKLTISLKSSFRRAFVLHSSFPLIEPLLASLYAFSSLVALDLNSFCVSELDDAAYERIAAAWPELRSLKVGVADVSSGKPMASVGAVIAVLRSCPFLETLQVVFDGTIPPPPPAITLELDERTQRGQFAASGETGGVEGRKEERVAARQARSWGVSNQQITQIHVGHSPIGGGADVLKELASCLRSVMPRLGIIQSKEPVVFDEINLSGSEGWQTVQRLLVEDEMDLTVCLGD